MVDLTLVNSNAPKRSGKEVWMEKHLRSLTRFPHVADANPIGLIFATSCLLTLLGFIDTVADAMRNPEKQRYPIT